MTDASQNPHEQAFNESPADRGHTATGTTRLNEAKRQALRVESRRWWIKLIVQPMLLLLCLAAGIALLGVAQRVGWISAGGSHGGGSGGGAVATAVDYICPMMCTPPQKEPGRCPVCAMELVPASTGGGGDERPFSWTRLLVEWPTSRLPT
jgi:hypothetical protein